MAATSTSTSLRLLSPSPHLKAPLKPSKSHHLLSLSSPISSHRLASAPAPAPPQSAAASPPPPPPAAVDPAHLPAPLRDIVLLFQSAPDAKARYRQLLAYAAKLPPMDPALKTDANRVRGCVSQVWVHAAPEDPGRVRFQADSDAQLTKGLAAMLVLGLSGEPAAEVASVPPAFIELLGIRQSLSPSRNSGLLNMLDLLKRKARQIAAPEAAEPAEEESFAVSVSEGNSDGRQKLEVAASSWVSGGLGDGKQEVEVAASVGANGGLGGGRKERIRARLEAALAPVELGVEDISHLHKGHAGAAGGGGETHFNVRLVSEEFAGKSLIKRHRLVYDLLQEELETGLHALSIDAKTPSEV